MSEAEITDLLLALADELSKCQSLANEKARDDIVDLLDHKIRVAIERRDDTQSDLRKIVHTCAQSPHGLQQLLDRIAINESEFLQWPAVKQAAEAYFAAAAQAKRKAEAASLAKEAEAKAAPAQNKLALVIGISRYEHGQAPGHELEPEQFTELKFADNDARSFYDFLVKEGSYEVLPPLLNQEACLHHILQGLDQLRQAAEQADDPLVVVFFSGHGATDAAGRNYLVPYDAKRNELFATALWNKTFNAALEEIKTDRLVLFVDACHAGAIAAEGVKDAGLLQYDPSRMVVAASQPKYCLVASCEAGQLSREYNGQGIFTAHLLELMKCEVSIEFEKEEVDLWELYDKLKLRVKTTASEKFGAVQVPYANLEGTTGIVITIDERRRTQRRQLERDYLQLVITEFDRTNPPKHNIMRNVLESFLDGVQLPGNLRNFLRLFQDQAADPDGYNMPFYCQQLSRRYKLDTGQAAQRPTAEEDRNLSNTTLTPSSPARVPVAGAPDQFSAALPAKTMVEPSWPIVKPSPADADRRRLTPEDRKEVLEPIWSPDFLSEARSLEALMSRLEGVSQNEIEDWLMDYHPDPANADALARWTPAAVEIWKRFKTRWAAATPMPMTQGAFALRNLRGGGSHAP